MKKLIIAACAFALAGLTQAATVGWGYGGSISNADAKGSAYQFFVIGQKGVTDAATIISAIANGTDVSAKAFGSGTTASGGTVTAAPASTGKTIDIPAESTIYEGFMVVFNDADISDATKFIAIENANCGTANGYKKTVGLNTTTINFQAGNVATYVNTASNWQAIAVPEPTSGLLMLLGVAGLALRRRRA